MRIELPRISIRQFVNGRLIASLFLVVMCVQIVSIEGYGVSPIKVGLMALAPLIFILKTPYISKALLLGILYWIICCFSALFHDYIRFSTIGYLGMFIISYIVFYYLVYSGVFSLNYFTRLLRYLIIAYGVVLLFQQVAMLVGVHSLALINLNNQFFLSLTKLPSLSNEPSHSARLLTMMMLGYLRCLEIADNGNRPTVIYLFTKEHRITTVLFLWTMLTMGSGTAFIGLGLLSLYFIQRKTIVYIIPALLVLFYIGQTLELSQMDRAIRLAEVAIKAENIETIHETEGSGAIRIIPLINTFTQTDLTDKNSWFGKGTISKEYAANFWKRTTDKLAIVEQYGLIAFALSLIFVYTCMIRRFFSIETLLFIVLFGFSIGNIAYTWGAVMVFTCIRYFQSNFKEINSQNMKE